MKAPARFAFPWPDDARAFCDLHKHRRGNTGDFKEGGSPFDSGRTGVVSCSIARPRLFQSASISFTRPTCPSSSITFMPCGCVGLFVRSRATTPSVSFPVRWSAFSTMLTCAPIFMSDLVLPSTSTPPSAPLQRRRTIIITQPGRLTYGSTVKLTPSLQK